MVYDRTQCKTCKYAVLWANGESADCIWRPHPSQRPPGWDPSHLVVVDLKDWCSNWKERTFYD